MKLTKSTQIIAVLLLIGINSALINGMAASTWYVKANDIIQFQVQVLNAGVTQVAGSMEINIHNIDASGLNYSISCDYTTDELGYEALLNSSSHLHTEENITILMGIILLYSKEQIDTIVSTHASTSKALESQLYEQYLGNKSVLYSLKILNYGYELKFQDEAHSINTYEKIQYSAKGLLTHYEISSLSTDQKESGIRIKQTSKGIPGYTLGGLFGTGIGTIALIMVYLRRKSKK